MNNKQIMLLLSVVVFTTITQNPITPRRPPRRPTWLATNVVMNEVTYFKLRDTPSGVIPQDPCYFGCKDGRWTVNRLTQIDLPSMGFLSSVEILSEEKQPRQFILNFGENKKEILIHMYGLGCQGCGKVFPNENYLHASYQVVGGSDEFDNRVLLCEPCIEHKGDLLTVPGLRLFLKKRGMQFIQGKGLVDFRGYEPEI